LYVFIIICNRDCCMCSADL